MLLAANSSSIDECDMFVKIWGRNADQGVRRGTLETELREPWCRVGFLQLNLTPTFQAANNAERARGYIQPHLRGIEERVGSESVWIGS
jgi:hypothetical protein